MKFSEGKVGRIFILRLEDGDKLPDTVESFAEENHISSAMCILVGGIKDGGNIAVGPEEGSVPPKPMLFELQGVHEIAGVGTLFPDEEGKPSLHMHAALGREGKTSAGCIRPGIETWKVGEVILLEITDSKACRKRDKRTGFKMLQP